MQKDWFEEIITTIENNAEDNKATISNVKLWAKSWREEKELALTLCGVIVSDFCEHPESERLKYKKHDKCLKCDSIINKYQK